MPMYDLQCKKCGAITADVYEPVEAPPRRCQEFEQLTHAQKLRCAGLLERAYWLNSGSVQGDEIDIEIKHALCWPDGTPRRFTSREELRREEKKQGWTNYVRHVGSKEGDKSKHTSRWY